jgi:hypothetical protein
VLPQQGYPRSFLTASLVPCPGIKGSISSQETNKSKGAKASFRTVLGRPSDRQSAVPGRDMAPASVLCASLGPPQVSCWDEQPHRQIQSWCRIALAMPAHLSDILCSQMTTARCHRKSKGHMTLGDKVIGQSPQLIALLA